MFIDWNRGLLVGTRTQLLSLRKREGRPGESGLRFQPLFRKGHDMAAHIYRAVFRWGTKQSLSNESAVRVPTLDHRVTLLCIQCSLGLQLRLL